MCSSFSFCMLDVMPELRWLWSLATHVKLTQARPDLTKPCDAQVLPPGDRVRIVEVGSGSGGTSVVVMAALADLAEHVEFVYTDISPQLVAYGCKTYGPRYPFVRFRLLDVEKDVGAQVGGPSQGMFMEHRAHAAQLCSPHKEALATYMESLLCRAMALAAMTSCSPPMCCTPRGTWA